MDNRGELPIDAGQELRYAAETQDEAYKRGAYDFVETLEMSPRLGIVAGYIRHLGLGRILDIGCGPGLLLDHLNPDVTYLGVDISPTAIQAARAKFGDRPNRRFHVGSFREWICPLVGLDCLVWAGIGRTWTRGGRHGRFEDWLEILDLAERALRPDAVVILEAVTPHWANLAPLIAGRYDALAGCEIDCLQDDHRTQRSVRVFRRRAE
ncbi:MAG: class I SAM-dependent methyltransferase [Kiloniellales bacterium]